MEHTRLHIQMRQTFDSLHTQAEEVYEMAKRIEDLSNGSTVCYAGLRLEARAARIND